MNHVKFSAVRLLKSSFVLDAFSAICFCSIGLVITAQSFDGSRMSNAATGPFVSFTIAVRLALTDFHPTLSVTVRLTVKFPGFWNVWFTIRPTASAMWSPLKSHEYPELRMTPGCPTNARSVDRPPSNLTRMPSSTLSVVLFAFPVPVRFVLILATGDWSSTRTLMFRNVRLPPTSNTVKFTVKLPDCAYLKVGAIPHRTSPRFGVNFQVKFAFVMWPFGSVLSFALNTSVVLPATYAW